MPRQLDSSDCCCSVPAVLQCFHRSDECLFTLKLLYLLAKKKEIDPRHNKQMDNEHRPKTLDEQ